MRSAEPCPIPARTLAIMAKIDENYIRRLAEGGVPDEEIPLQCREDI